MQFLQEYFCKYILIFLSSLNGCYVAQIMLCNVVIITCYCEDYLSIVSLLYMCSVRKGNGISHFSMRGSGQPSDSFSREEGGKSKKNSFRKITFRMIRVDKYYAYKSSLHSTYEFSTFKSLSSRQHLYISLDKSFSFITMKAISGKTQFLMISFPLLQILIINHFLL